MDRETFATHHDRHGGWALSHRAGPRGKESTMRYEASRSRVCLSWRLVIIGALLLPLLRQAAALPPEGRAAAPAPDEYVRVGTFNAQFLPLLPGTSSNCCEDIPDRARKLADRIIAGDYDIIALNEIFVEEARDELVRRLRDRYPHYVELIETGAPSPDCVITLQLFCADSGLMLFSRFRFERLPMATYRHDSNDLIAWNGEHSVGLWGDVAFVEYSYDDCEGFDDCHASKGAALVRAVNPSSGRIYNVVFTHMDSDETEDARAAREGQLRAVRRMIEGTLTAEQIRGEDIFVMGDLNINGDLLREGHASGTPNEWQRRFGPGGDFFHHTLRDAWEYETQLIVPGEQGDDSCSEPPDDDPCPVAQRAAGQLEIVRTFPVGPKPVALVGDPARNKLHVLNGDATVSVHAHRSGERLATIPLGGVPDWLAIDPKDRRVYAANATLAGVRGIAVIDAVADKLAPTPLIPVTTPIADFATYFGPDGGVVYLALGTRVWAVEGPEGARTLRELALPFLPSAPVKAVAVDTARKRLCVATAGGTDFAPRVMSYALPSHNYPTARALQHEPTGLLLDPSTLSLYVVHRADNRLSRLSLGERVSPSSAP